MEHDTGASSLPPELVLLVPAALSACQRLSCATLQPLHCEPARSCTSADCHVVFGSVLDALGTADRPCTVFAAMLAGCVTLLRNWTRVPDPQRAARQPSVAILSDPATRIITVAILAAGAILAVVALHMLAN